MIFRDDTFWQFNISLRTYTRTDRTTMQAVTPGCLWRAGPVREAQRHPVAVRDQFADTC
jgi:hypothetical protein